MEKSKTKAVIRIQGNDYTIASSESEEFVQRVAYYINKKFDEISARNKKLSTTLIATFASMNIAEEYLKTSDDNKILSEKMQIISELDEKKTAEIDMLRRKNEAYENEIQRLKIQIAKLEKQYGGFENGT